MVQDHGYISHLGKFNKGHQPYGILFFITCVAQVLCHLVRKAVPPRYIHTHHFSHHADYWAARDRINHSESSASLESKLSPLMEPIRPSFFEVTLQIKAEIRIVIPLRSSSINIFPAI